LSYFYTASELTIRFTFFWTLAAVADIIASFLAFGILHMGGLHGLAGWRWLFLIEGLMTLAVGILSFGMMPGRDIILTAYASISYKYYLVVPWKGWLVL
jgi:hypothetical protein